MAAVIMIQPMQPMISSGAPMQQPARQVQHTPVAFDAGFSCLHIAMFPPTQNKFEGILSYLK
jgi:hypothetical protein